MNYLMQYFDRENELLKGKFNDYRPALEILTGIFDNHGHSGSSAGFVIGHLKRYCEIRSVDVGLTEVSVYKVDPNFKDLFDQLDMWYCGTEDLPGVRIGLKGTDPIRISEDGEFIDYFTLLDTFISVANQEPIGPLTGEDHEWNEVGNGTYQNKRMSSIFKNDKKGYAHWLGGCILIDWFQDYSGYGTYGSNRTPDYRVEFPFDPIAHQCLYYVTDKKDSKTIAFHGTWDEIEERLKTHHHTLRRNWMLGFEEDGKTIRSEILMPVTYNQLCATIVHFDEVIKPMLEREGFDLYHLKPEELSLFEGSSLNFIPITIQAMLYRASVIYSELDKEERQKLFRVSTRIDVFYAAERHYQGFQPYGYDDHTDQAPEAAVGTIYLDKDLQVLEDKDIRTYLFNQCKVKGLEFKPGKLGTIVKRLSPSEALSFSGCFTPVLNEKEDYDFSVSFHKSARKWKQTQVAFHESMKR